MSPGPSWENAKKILCIRLDNMGDVLMTTPAMKALKDVGFEKHITLLASPSGALLAPFLPFINETIAYDAPWVKNTKDDVLIDENIISSLRDKQFDGAVIFTVYSQSPLPAALMCRMAGIPLTLAHCRENPYLLLSDWVAETEPTPVTRHEVQRQLDLVRQIGARSNDARLTFETIEEDRVKLCEKLDANQINLNDRWIVAHCGATAPSRRYPVEQYIEALQQIGARAGQVILTGDVSERNLTQQIFQKCTGKVPIVDLAGTLTLGEFACLIQDAALLLSNNTGPVHIAAALGTPIVDLYALTNPQHTPWMVPHRILFHDVPCKYCYKSTCPEGHHDCLRLVPPERVSSAVTDLIADMKRRTPVQAVV